MSKATHRRLIVLSLAALATAACSPAPQPESAGTAKDDAARQDEAAAKQDEAPRDDAAETPAPSSGGEFVMPSWFTEDIVEHAAVVQQQRTDTEADGSFKAFILFEMNADETAESCIEKFKAKLPAELKMADTAPPPGPEGRLQILGTTDAYEVSVMCGKAKDKNSAILNFNKKPG